MKVDIRDHLKSNFHILKKLTFSFHALRVQVANQVLCDQQYKIILTNTILSTNFVTEGEKLCLQS